MIDKCELAILHNGEFVSGLYEEIELYCNKSNTAVIRYLDHVNPASVRNGFKYVGSGRNPYELQRGFDYELSTFIEDNSF